MSILQDLWHGQLCPIAQAAHRDDIQKMQDLTEEMGQRTECAAFSAGFRLAVQLMAASFEG